MEQISNTATLIPKFLLFHCKLSNISNVFFRIVTFDWLPCDSISAFILFIFHFFSLPFNIAIVYYTEHALSYKQFFLRKKRGRKRWIFMLQQFQIDGCKMWDMDVLKWQQTLWTLICFLNGVTSIIKPLINIYIWNKWKSLHFYRSMYFFIYSTESNNADIVWFSDHWSQRRNIKFRSKGIILMKGERMN